jgi:hypothetical protein
MSELELAVTNAFDPAGDIATSRTWKLLVIEVLQSGSSKTSVVLTTNMSPAINR